MKDHIRKITFAVGSFLFLATTAFAASNVPKQIRIIVPFSAGASNDAIARAIAPQLAKRLNTVIIVENRAGAAGIIGTDYVAKAPKDGSTLLLTSSSFLTSAATQPNLAYDPVKSFVPVAMVGQGPLVLAVSAAKPYQTVPQLLAAASKTPDALNFGTAGIGSLGHLATVMLTDDAKVSMTHVPYKGAANAASDLAAGLVDVMLANYSSLAPLIQAKMVKVIATTSPDATKAFPDIPPVAATVPGYDINIWVGVFAPAGTPQDIVDLLNQEINEISASPTTAALLDLDGTVPSKLTSPDFAARVQSDYLQWQKVAKDHAITVQ